MVTRKQCTINGFEEGSRTFNRFFENGPRSKKYRLFKSAFLIGCIVFAGCAALNDPCETLEMRCLGSFCDYVAVNRCQNQYQ